MNFRHVLAALIVALLPPSMQARDASAPIPFQGRHIVSVSDADMLASAYVDGQLGPREGTDALSVIALAGDPRDWKAVEVPVTNSVAGPPAAVELSPDGRWAFVVETFAQRPAGEAGHTFGDLAVGNTLTVVDLRETSAPRVAQVVRTRARPQAVRMDPRGRWLAVTFHRDGTRADAAPIALYPFDGSRLGDPVSPPIDGWNRAGNLIDVDWHPVEPVLAMIDELGGTLRFARVSASGDIRPFGNVVPIERTPFRVEFTPDGRHAVVNALYWGPDIAGTWIEAPRGSVLTVRMDAQTIDGTTRHAFVSRVMTGVSPEGLAVSPDGRWVATTNLERSYLPHGDPRATYFSSITLARLEQATGQLTAVGTFSYDGILPEAAVFDASGSHLAVATFDHFDDRIRGGSIDLWRIQADPLEPSNVQLVKTRVSVPVTRGVHSMAIAR